MRNDSGINTVSSGGSRLRVVEDTLIFFTNVKNAVMNGKKAMPMLFKGLALRVLFFVRFYAISGACTQKCASCDCINFLVIMKVSHHGSKASLENSFVLILYKIIRAEAGILRFLTHDSFFHCVG